MTLARLGCKGGEIPGSGSGDFTVICQADRSGALQGPGDRAVRGCPVDVDAGHGAALGRALSAQPVEIPLLQRLRSIFSGPGIGKLVVDAIFDRDYPMIQGFVIFMGTVFLLINLLVDLGYGIIDPRIRLVDR